MRSLRTRFTFNEDFILKQSIFREEDLVIFQVDEFKVFKSEVESSIRLAIELVRDAPQDEIASRAERLESLLREVEIAIDGLDKTEIQKDLGDYLKRDDKHKV